MTKAFRDWMLFLMLGVFALSGCAALKGQPQTPRETYADVNDSVIAAFQILTEAKLAGMFNDVEVNRIADVVIAIDKLMDAYDAATKAGLNGAGLLEQIRAALDKLSPYIDKAAQKTKKADGGNPSYREFNPDAARSPGSDAESRVQESGGRGGLQRSPQQSPQGSRRAADQQADARAGARDRACHGRSAYLREPRRVPSLCLA